MAEVTKLNWIELVLLLLDSGRVNLKLLLKREKRRLRIERRLS